MHSGRKTYCVYIITNRSKTLYIGVTNNLERRIWEHKHHNGSEFASRYKLDRLVYWESFDDVCKAIDREKQIKGWLRIKKIALIVSENPTWSDLSAEWFTRHRYQPDEKSA
jgi:putative endonuclease